MYINDFKCVEVAKQLLLLPNYSSNQDAHFISNVHTAITYVIKPLYHTSYFLFNPDYISERAYTWLYDLARWALNQKLPPIEVCHGYLEATESLHQADTLGHMEVTAFTIEILQQKQQQRQDATFMTRR